MGLMVPDLDIFFKYLALSKNLHGGPLHSIIFGFIYIYSFINNS